MRKSKKYYSMDRLISLRTTRDITAVDTHANANDCVTAGWDAGGDHTATTKNTSFNRSHNEWVGWMTRHEDDGYAKGPLRRPGHRCR